MWSRQMKICLDPGHGGEDKGALFRGLKEKDIVLDIALSCMEQLQVFHWTALTRTSDRHVSLDKRVTLANWWQANLFVSIHCNADPDPDEPGMPEASGEEIWVYPGSTSGLRVARAIKDHIDSFFPVHPFRGIKESRNLYVLRHTKMPAVLIETGFIDNIGEHKAFQEAAFRRGIGKQLARGLLDYDKGQKPA
jgi:N-acetylmuramoyl-L-alanine amidase